MLSVANGAAPSGACAMGGAGTSASERKGNEPDSTMWSTTPAAHTSSVDGGTKPPEASAPGATAYVLADLEPAPSSDVLRYASTVHGIQPPQSVAYEDVEPKLSAAQRAFWRTPLRVASQATLARLGVVLRYPTYREGLRATIAVEGPLPHLPHPRAASTGLASTEGPVAEVQEACTSPTSAPKAVATTPTPRKRSNAKTAAAGSLDEAAAELCDAEGWVRGDDGMLHRLWNYGTRVEAYKAYGRIVTSTAYKPEWVQPQLRLEDFEMQARLALEGEPGELLRAARFIAKKAETPRPRGQPSPTLLEQMDGS